jgi:hypothetical protein
MLLHGMVAGFFQDVVPALAAIVVLGFIVRILWDMRQNILQSGQQPEAGQSRPAPFVVYGHLIVVSLGIVAVVIAFLITMLFSADLFQKTSQVLAILTALFGVIGTLVGTYFGIKASSDATHTAQQQTQTAQQQMHDMVSDTPPTIVSVIPPRDVEDVKPDTPITATFSEEMDPASIKGTNHFTLVRVDTERTAHTPVIGDVNYGPLTNSPRVAAFVPANDLEHGRTYHATVTQGVRDLRGNTLANPYTWQFKVKPKETRQEGSSNETT